MLRKEDILENVDQYSADQLVTYIKEGIVTFDELCEETDGEFSAPKRREVKHKLESGDSDEWNKVQAERTVEAVDKYLASYPNGQFRSQARALKAQLEKKVKDEILKSTSDDAWSVIDKTDINSLRQFVKDYPDSSYVKDANNLIDTLLLEEIMDVDVEALVNQILQFQTNQNLTPAQKDNNILDTIERFINEKKITKEDFLEKFAEDHNLLNAAVVKKLINKGTVTVEDLVRKGFDKKFIQKMFIGEVAQSFSTPEKLEKINKQSTEIYFWGIPSSGKSCALGAILSVAASGRVARSMDPDTESQGYGYMMKLINLFQNGEVGTLMEGTSVDSFYEMGFDLVDNDDKIHPITCIDMAGELMRCMFKANAGDPMSETDEIMLDTMTKVLIDNRSTNRKMHIFVIEYGAENRLYEGLPQRVYLEGAVSYIKNTGIFRKDTDAIYIMITKADKAKNATKDTFTNYINEKYLGFYNGLEQICKDNEINRGKVEKLAFSLGDVCFQNYCRFNSRPAENVVNLILQRSASFRGGRRGMFESIFRG